MRVVIDTNVFISGVYWHGAPNNVLLAWEAGRFDVAASRAILEEYSRVLNEFEQPPEDRARWDALLGNRVHMVVPTEEIDAIPADPDDNKFLAAAVEAEAQFVVSGDKHLLALRVFRGIRILTPAAFLRELE
jgi:putative PIN family toxin of toxin-antitoxin system